MHTELKLHGLSALLQCLFGETRCIACMHACVSVCVLHDLFQGKVHISIDVDVCGIQIGQ